MSRGATGEPVHRWREARIAGRTVLLCTALGIGSANAQAPAQSDTTAQPTSPPSALPSPPAPSPPATPPSASAIATPQAAADSGPDAGIPAVVIDGQKVESILGKRVRSSSREDMGRIVDVIVDKTGLIRAAIIDFGGFLGVGTRQIAVDWRALRFPSDQKSEALTVDLTRDQLRVAPAYKAGEQIVVLGRPHTEPAVTAAPTPSRDAAQIPYPQPPQTSPPQQQPQ